MVQERTYTNNGTGSSIGSTTPPSPRGFAAIVQTINNLIWSIVLGHVMRYAYVTFYFIATQNGWVRPGWNSLLSGAIGAALWTILRHFLRAGLESELTSATVWVLLANPFKMYLRPTPTHGFKRFVKGLFVPVWLLSLLKRLHIPTPDTYERATRLTWWQWAGAVPALLIAGSPGFALGAVLYGVARLTGLASSSGLQINLSAYPGWLQQDLSLVTADWQYTLAGILGTLFYARLVFKVYAAELMEALARQMAAHCQAAQTRNHSTRAALFAAHRFYPVGYRTAFQTAYQLQIKPSMLGAVMLSMVVLYLVFAVPFGYIILAEVATGHWVIPGFH